MSKLVQILTFDIQTALTNRLFFSETDELEPEAKNNNENTF